MPSGALFVPPIQVEGGNTRSAHKTWYSVEDEGQDLHEKKLGGLLCRTPGNVYDGMARDVSATYD